LGEGQASALPELWGVFMTTPRFSDEITFVAIRSALSCARMFVLSTLTRRKVLSVLGDAVTATEKLVARAVNATGVVDGYPARQNLRT
jgi:hypothetical protein